MKLAKQIFLILFEIIVCTYTLTNLSLLIAPAASLWNLVERYVFCYGIYQFATFLILSNINDSRRDMYLAVLTNYRCAELYLNSSDSKILSIINTSIDTQRKKWVFNDTDIKDAYEHLIYAIEQEDLSYIKYQIIYYEHSYELESLAWRFNFVLRIFK